ncbi:D-alanyl-D-alanine endopeptidase [Denitratisoma sp. DHT3]|uniref:D-alanyl-D-alanine endopeptidase n=1 Tax=Denitratisoma sp. DHT3 TaxID=1981880 RepID=UPI0011987D2A|nr:D-alanyl-D-alanine endopeptidase [Denitratisoma sp. DHT3]QDX79982.1 D-alanyl-D-alanine endopeptidase [Denitratisoma sp. DHT3]
MKKTVISLAVSIGLAMGMVSGEALATTHKKKPVAAKKQVRAQAAKKASPAHRARQSASLDEAQHLVLGSAAALVQDQTTGAILFEKNAGAVVPIASITKLMTAMVALDAKPGLEETLSIGDDDVDTLKGTHSRLRVGTELSRENMLRLALMSSENRAASALSRHYPGGRAAFVAAMNRKAQALGLTDTHFEDPTGLTAANVSSARDLTKMVAAAHQYPLIREFSTTSEYQVPLGRRTETFRNTNMLVRTGNWDIGLSKTGFINEAGRCLVMQAWLNNKPTIIVLLDSWGKFTRIGDANRIKRWIESASLNARPSAGLRISTQQRPESASLNARSSAG